MKIDHYELTNLSLADLYAIIIRFDITQDSMTEECSKLLHTAVYKEIKIRLSNLFIQ